MFCLIKAYESCPQSDVCVCVLFDCSIKELYSHIFWCVCVRAIQSMSMYVPSVDSKFLLMSISHFKQMHECSCCWLCIPHIDWSYKLWNIICVFIYTSNTHRDEVIVGTTSTVFWGQNMYVYIYIYAVNITTSVLLA